ncbi:hypothetical protein ACFXTI_014446 [Malus domestica]
MDGNQVPQDLVTKVGEVFKNILKETDAVRQESSEDMSITRAFSIVFERKPELRLEGVAHKEELLPGGHGLMVRGYLPVINTLAKEDGRTFVADAAVVAVPLGVLKAKSITFEPKLPDWKEAATESLD